MKEIQVGQIWADKGRRQRHVKVEDISLTDERVWARRVGSFARRGGHGHFLYPRIEYDAKMFLRYFRLVPEGEAESREAYKKAVEWDALAAIGRYDLGLSEQEF